MWNRRAGEKREGVDRITGYLVDLRSRKPKPMDCEDITKKIIGHAYNVYNVMGFGFLESAAIQRREC